MLLQPPVPVPLADDAPIIDWGSVPDWIAGVSGFLAFVAAVIAVVYAVKGFRLQGAQIQALEADKRVEQAAQVAAYFDDLSGKREYTLINSSPVPVYAMLIWMFQPETEENPDGKARVSSLYVQHILHPGKMTVELKPSKFTGPTAVGFLDSAGRAWIRTGASALIEIERDALKSLLNRIPVEEIIVMDLRDWIDKSRVHPKPKTTPSKPPATGR